MGIYWVVILHLAGSNFFSFKISYDFSRGVRGMTGILGYLASFSGTPESQHIFSMLINHIAENLEEYYWEGK